LDPEPDLTVGLIQNYCHEIRKADEIDRHPYSPKVKSEQKFKIPTKRKKFNSLKVERVRRGDSRQIGHDAIFINYLLILNQTARHKVPSQCKLRRTVQYRFV
jgi:hypothetical protein